mgnify:CR=1 FL=1|jgi:hypothetical protein
MQDLLAELTKEDYVVVTEHRVVLSQLEAKTKELEIAKDQLAKLGESLELEQSNVDRLQKQQKGLEEGLDRA